MQKPLHCGILTISGTSLSFAYDSSGLRTGKTVSGTTYRYYYASGKLMRLTWGSNTVDFFYDANGTPYSMKYNGTLYYYVTNLQGDVMRVVNASGTVVASYDYDPYGKVISATGTLANVNPLRYRGYVYDTETGFYYLQSRYSDPEIGRFINADSYASTGQGIVGYNMFAYCGNSPVCNTDAHGTKWVRWTRTGPMFPPATMERTFGIKWKLGAAILKAAGYPLSGDLLYMAVNGPNEKYYASENSPIAKQIASDEGFANAVRKAFSDECDGGIDSQSKKNGYEFPVSQGDLGAALHIVSYSYRPFREEATGEQCLYVTVTDTFDFTELRNPFKQESIKSGFLWLANDIACLDSRAGILNPVSVEINVVIPLYP